MGCSAGGLTEGPPELEVVGAPWDRPSLSGRAFVGGGGAAREVDTTVVRSVSGALVFLDAAISLLIMGL